MSPNDKSLVEELRGRRDRTDREALRRAYESAAARVREETRMELDELDHLAGEGID